MKLLVVASDRREFSAIVSRAGIQMLLVANGVGAQRAAEAVDANASFRPDAIVSTGFCGALDPELKIADIVVASSVVAAGRIYPATPVGTKTNVIVTVDHVVQSAAEKHSLAASGAGAVDMEAAGVASRAEALHVPFYCIKAVSDLAGEDLANDFNRALTPDGHFDTMVLLRGTLGRPFARIPELLRLRKRCVRASRALGDFFADCRF